MEIIVISEPVGLEVVRQAAAESFVDMVKAVVDVGRGILALGGELHADAEAVLLADGSRQDDLWGINLYPEKPASEWIEYSSLINVRPRAGNRSLVIQDLVIQGKIRAVVERLISKR